MKIVHVETGRHLYGGPQQVIYLSCGLRELGVDNVLVCPPGSGVAEAAREAGIRTIEVGCAGDFDLRFAFRLRRILTEERPDLVHCHSRRGGDFLGGLAAGLARVPAVLSRRVDNLEPEPLARLRYRRFARIVAISATIRDVLVDAGVEPRRIVVIRSAVDAERFARVPDRERFRQEFGLAHDARVVAAAGQFIPRKGHRYLLEAAAILKPRYPSLAILLFGRGPLLAELRQRAEHLGVDDVVRFPGFRRDLDDYLACCELLVHPALAEGLGVVTLKAQAAGVPVVGFRAGGLAEAVLDGKTGLLVTTGDVEALAGAVARLLDDSALRRRYATAGKRRMREQFSIAAMAERHLELYESILNARD